MKDKKVLAKIIKLPQNSTSTSNCFGVKRVEKVNCKNAADESSAKNLQGHYVIYRKGQDPKDGCAPLTASPKLPFDSMFSEDIIPRKLSDGGLLDGTAVRGKDTQFIVPRRISCPNLGVKSVSESMVNTYIGKPSTKIDVIEDVLKLEVEPLNPKCLECVAYNKKLKMDKKVEDVD